MAPSRPTNSKRKCTSTATAANKRRKLSRGANADPDDLDEGSLAEDNPSEDDPADDGKDWEVRAILGERIENGEVKYLCEWVDIDPETGRVYEPSWQPPNESYAVLLEAWEQRTKRVRWAGEKRAREKRAREARAREERVKRRAAIRASRTGEGKQKVAPQPPPAPPRKRRSRVIESTPEPPTVNRSRESRSRASTPNQSSLPSSPADTDTLPIDRPPTRNSPQIPVSFQNSADLAVFERHSQLQLSSSSRDLVRQNPSLSFNSQASFTPTRRYQSTLVVEDSEDEETGEDRDISGVVADSREEENREDTYIPSVGAESDDSYIPSIEEECESSRGSSLTGDSKLGSEENTPVDEDQEEAVATSAAPEQASADRVAFTASIPETQSDPIEDSQEQGEAGNQREVSDSYDTAERVESSSQLVEQQQQQQEVQEHEHPSPLPQQPAIEEGNEEESAEQTTVLDSIDTTSGASNLAAEEQQSGDQEQSEPIPAEQVHSQPAPPTINPSETNPEPVEAVSPSVDNLATPAEEQPVSLDNQTLCSTEEQQNSSNLNRDLGIDHASVLDIAKDVDQVAAAPAILPSEENEDNDTEESIERRDFAAALNASPVVDSLREVGSAPSEQHAQGIPSEPYLSSQNSLTQRILTIVEKDEPAPQLPASEDSRHDSSQESPDSSPNLFRSSWIARPPEQSLGTAESNPPPRPQTPVDRSPSSSSSNMGDKNDIDKAIEKAIEQRRAENPFTPKDRLRRSNIFSSSGTRSPSTIPDRSPLPQAPTSLRTVAMADSALEVTTEPDSAASASEIVQDEPESGGSDNNHAAAIPVVTATSTEDDELSDAVSESGSVFTDDLHLTTGEFIVPLPIAGRQASMYRDEMMKDRALLVAFIEDPQGFDEPNKVDKVIQRLRAIETHMDLLYSETDKAAIGASTQLQHQRQWTVDNSIKFRFIGNLLAKLQERDMHVILVIEKGDDSQLSDLVETFLRSQFIRFKFPVNGHQADPTAVEGNLLVTVLSSDSSPIVQPPDLIICLDGSLEAVQIRKKMWAKNPDRALVPLLHLVIPRTVNHIERYISSSLNQQRRLHTIVASLAQLHGQIGKAMYAHSPISEEAAASVVAFLTSLEEGEEQVEWPLPSIGSIKDVIEFQSRQSQESISSPPSGSAPVVSTSGKRPLVEADELDPSKRRRYTPQPQPQTELPAQPVSSANDNDVTHISDSMPGTAVDVAYLQEQLTKKTRTYEKVLALLKQAQAKQVDWEKQQTVHEELSKTYTLLKLNHENQGRTLKAANNSNTTKQEHIDAQNTIILDLRTKIRELEAIMLASPDANIAELVHRRKREGELTAERERALKKAADAESLMEYTKEVYRNIQSDAASLRQENSELLAKVEALEKERDSKAPELREAHHDKRYKLVVDQLERRDTEIAMLKRQAVIREQEIERLKTGRGVGVGTRAQSVGMTPRPGSRAASPLPVGRDRLSNLRNG